MASTQTLLKAYGNIPIPNRLDEMTYQEACDRGTLDVYSIRQALMRLYERDIATILEDRGSQPITLTEKEDDNGIYGLYDKQTYQP